MQAKYDNNTVLDALQQFLGEGLIAHEETYGMLSVEVKPNRILQLFQHLFEHPTLQFQFLTDVTGIHFPNSKGKEIGVIYHLHSLQNNIRIRIKAFVPVEKPHIASLTPLYAGANWMEREAYDFYGIIFDGHPNLKRILNVDEMDYFPMRKEYPLEDGTRTDKQDKYFGR